MNYPLIRKLRALASKLRLTSFSATAVLMVLTSAPVSSAATIPPDLESTLTKILTESKVQGVSMLLIEQGSSQPSLWQWNTKSQKNISAETLFRGGSLSKLVTSTLILRATESGLLKLDDPVQKHLPGIFTTEFNFQESWVDSVTIAQLLEHTSGLAGSTYSEYAAVAPNLSPTDYVQNNTPFKLRWAPGIHYSYANSGHTIAAALLEKVTGKSFDDYASEELFGPLGMTHSSFDNTLGKVRGLSPTFDSSGKEITRLWQAPVRPAGSLVSHPADLQKLMAMLLAEGQLPDGTSYLTPASIQRMHTGETSSAGKNGVKSGCYGLGNFGFISSGYAFRGHWGRTDGFQTNFGYLPKHRCGFILMLNTADRYAIQQLRKTIAAYITQGLPPEKQPSPIKDITAIKPGYYLGYSHDMEMRAWIFGLLEAKRIEPTTSGIRVRDIFTGGQWKSYDEVLPNMYKADGIPVPTGTFHIEEGAAFFVDGESFIATTPMRLYGEMSILLLGILTSILCLLIMPIFIVVKWRKKQPVLAAVLILISSASLLMLLTVFYFYGLAGMGHHLGSPSTVSISLLVLSLLFPATSAAAFFSKSISRVLRVCSALLLLSFIPFFIHGWCPLITWAS